jgi:DNA invertase Pin-like site-specific DNA recombinase
LELSNGQFTPLTADVTPVGEDHGHAPAGRLQMPIAEFERARIAERVRLGLARVGAQGKQLGRPRLEVSAESLVSASGLSIRSAGKVLGRSPATIYRRARATQR